MYYMPNPSPFQSPMNPMFNQTTNMTKNTYMKMLLKKLKGKTVDILINSRESIYEEVEIKRVENGVVITEVNEEVVVIPIRFISSIFISKEDAEEVWSY